MVSFLLENGGTMVIGLILLGIVIAIVVKMIRDKRKGKVLGCDCGCSECHYSAKCHTE